MGGGVEITPSTALLPYQFYVREAGHAHNSQTLRKMLDMDE